MEKLIFNPEEAIDVEMDDIFKDDYFGFEKSVIDLGKLISQSKAPISIAIYGDWGSGKTSFMKLLRCHLIKEFKFEAFWFDAWKYENDLNLVLPFLSEISKSLGDYPELKSSISRIGYAASLSLSDLMLKVLTIGQSSTKTIKEHFEYYEQNVAPMYESWHSQTIKSNEEFEKIVDKLRKDKKLTIFIDDLDRCLPDNVINLIESIKHLFFVKNCIFIIGADKTTLSKGIAAKYGTGLIKGDDYLEKIINISFSMPDVKEEIAIKKFMQQMAKDMAVSEWQKNIEVHIDILGDSLIRSNVKHVPRKFKKILQRFMIFLALDGEMKPSFMKIAVCVYLIMKEFYPCTYALRELRKNIAFHPTERSSGRRLDIKEIAEEYGINTAEEFHQLHNKSSYLFEGWLAQIPPDKKASVVDLFREVSRFYNL